MSVKYTLKASTQVVFDEFIKQGANVKVLDSKLSLLEYQDLSGAKHLMFSTSSDKSSSVGAMIAQDKLKTEVIAKDIGLTMPASIICTSYGEALAFLDTHKTIVLKPATGYGGKGVNTGISDPLKLRIAYDHARQYGERVIAQEHVTGGDFRLLVVGGVFRSAIERRPAAVTGDGISSIKALVDLENSSPNRSSDYSTLMSLIDVGSTVRFLGSTIDEVPNKGERTQVVGPANLSLGGSVHEATSVVLQSMITDAETIVGTLGLGICGVDMIWDKNKGTYYLIEVNSTPRIDMHNDPFWNTSTNATERYVEWLLNPSTTMTR